MGPPRLEPDRRRAGRRRVVPRAVPERDRRQAAAGARRMRGRGGLRVPHGHRAAARARRPRGDRGDRERRGAEHPARARGDLERARPRRGRDGNRARATRQRGLCQLLAGRQDAHAARPGRPGGAHAQGRSGAPRGHASGRRSPVWVVTGTDPVGLELAARTLQQGRAAGSLRPRPVCAKLRFPSRSEPP